MELVSVLIQDLGHASGQLELIVYVEYERSHSAFAKPENPRIGTKVKRLERRSADLHKGEHLVGFQSYLNIKRFQTRLDTKIQTHLDIKRLDWRAD